MKGLPATPSRLVVSYGGSNLLALIWLRTSGSHDGMPPYLVGGLSISLWGGGGADLPQLRQFSFKCDCRNWMILLWRVWNHGGYWETHDVVPLLNPL